MKIQKLGLYEKFRMTGYPFMLSLAFIVGIMAGGVAVGFRLLIEYVQLVFYGEPSPAISVFHQST